MKPFLKNIFIGFAVLITIVFIGTCTMNRNTPGKPPALTDTTFVGKWKAEKEQELKTYSAKLSALQVKNDSLVSEVSFKKKQLFVYQYKSKTLESKLEQFALKLDSSHAVKDSLTPLVDSLVVTEAASDSTCNQTVRELEKIIANRDSSISVYKNETATLRDLQKEQADREQLLTEELNTAYKTQKKIALNGKLLSGGLILLSGFTGALLINQHLK